MPRRDTARRSPLNGVTVVRDYESPATVELFTDLLRRDGPLFVGRIGGSDYNVVVQYFNNRKLFRSPSLFERLVQPIRGRLDTTLGYPNAAQYVGMKNGYFDLQNSRENFVQYLEDMVRFYKNSDVSTYGSSTLIREFENGSFASDRNFLQYILEGKTAINYTFIEAVLPFLQSFTKWGEGKTILVVSPLSQSVEHQYARRNQLIHNYQFPNFTLKTYTTKVTYSAPGDTKESLGIATNNWHEECQRINTEIEKIDFDVALLSCASYAMGVGDHIRSIGKKAIYLGGVLNVLFNIYGKRYDTPFFNSLVNLDTQINPVENETIRGIRGGRGMHNEGLNAYFGTKTHE